MTLRLTNSEKGAYQRCKRMWWVQYYRGLRPKREKIGSASYLGTVVHDALAVYYQSQVGGFHDDVEGPIALIDRKHAEALEQFPIETESINKVYDLARIMVEGYLEWVAEEGEDADLIIEGSESMAEAQLVEGVTLLAKLDAPVTRERDGAKLALEHKTTDSLEDRLQGAKLESQFLTEHLVRFLISLERGATPEEAIADCEGVLLNMLRKVKRTSRANPPFYGREVVRHNVHELRNHWRHVVAVAQEIQETTARLDAGEDHHLVVPPNPIPKDCSWRCDLYRICVMADDGSDFEGALAATFEERDPLDRYEGAEAL